MPLMSETLTEVAAHVRAQLSPVNHYQNDKKKKKNTQQQQQQTFRRHRAVGRDEASHSDPVDLLTHLHWHGSEQSVSAT